MGFKNLVSILPLLVACSDVPDREKFPGGQGRTTDFQQAETQRGVLGGFDPMNSRLPGGGGSASGANGGGGGDKAPPSKEESVSGTVTLAPNVVVRAGSFLFILARNPAGGPPMAAKREYGPEFPFKFTLSGQDAMMAGTPFEGEFDLVAKLDQDGDPISKQKGDFTGTIKVKVGQHGIKLIIGQAIDPAD